MPAWNTYLRGGLNNAERALKEIEDLRKQIPKTKPQPVPIPPLTDKKTKRKTKQPPLPGVVRFNDAMKAVDTVLAPYAGWDPTKSFDENAAALGKDILKSFITQDDSQQREEIYDAMKKEILSQKHPRQKMQAFINRRL